MVATPSPPQEPVHDGFVRFARYILANRFRILFLIVALTGLMGYQILTKLKVDNSIEAFTANSGEPQRVLTELRSYFGRDDVFLVLIEGDVFTEGYVQRLKAFTDELWQLYPDLEDDPYLAEEGASKGATAPKKVIKKPAVKPKESTSTTEAVDDFDDEFEGDVDFEEPAPGKPTVAATAPMVSRTIFEEITSLINVRRAKPSGGGVSFPKLMDPVPDQAALNAMKEEVLNDRFLAGNIVSKDGTVSIVNLRTPAMRQYNTEIIYEELLKIAERHSADGFEINVSGIPALTVELNRLMFGDLKRMLLIATLLIILVLFLLFRHPLGVIAPLAVVMMSAVWTFGMMATVGLTMTLLSSILPAFLTCVGVGDSIHLMSVYRDRRHEGYSNEDSISYAMGTVGTPIVYTSLTTLMGLMSFQLSSLDAIAEMGLAGAFGVLMAMFFSLLFLPIALSFNRKGTLGLKKREKRDALDGFLTFCGGLSRPGTGKYPHRRRFVALAAMVVLLLLSIVGISKMGVSHDPLSWIPKDNPVMLSFNTIEKHFGGSSNIELLIRPNTDRGIGDLELLRGLDELDQHIRGYVHSDGRKIVGQSFSMVDLVKETHRAFNGLDPAADRLPSTQGEIDEIIGRVEDGNRDALRKIATTGLDHSRMSFRVRWMDATSYFPLTEHIEEGIRSRVGDKAEIKKSGGLYTVFSIVGHLLFDLMKSFLVAFGVITLLMVFFLKSLRLGLVAMIPNLLPIAFIMGLMGFGEIPIDVNNLLIASIAMGLAVDDTIHFLHHFKVQYAITGVVESSVDHAIRYCGRAIVVTSLILCIGFYSYMGADMTNIQRFGLLVGTTVIAALLIDLIFAPALIRTVYPNDDVAST